MIIKISIPGVSKKFIPNDLLNFSKNNNVKVFINDPSIVDCDFWFIVEDIFINDSEKVKCRKIIFLGAETVYSYDYFKSPWMIDFIKQFDMVYSTGFIQGKDVINSPPFLPWMYSGNHGHIYGYLDKNSLPLNSNSKYSNKISVICSDKQLNETQRLRFNFVVEIKKYFKDSIDWFGSGVNPIDIKSNAINSYKYHIVLENQIRNNLFSEKIYDSYLGLAMPIYSGAPNISSYFPKDSLIEIDIFDIRESIFKIEKLISSNYYEENLFSIKYARELVLNKYNILNRIINISNSLDININKKFVCFNSKSFLKRRYLLQNPLRLLKYKFNNYINSFSDIKY